MDNCGPWKYKWLSSVFLVHRLSGYPETTEVPNEEQTKLNDEEWDRVRKVIKLKRIHRKLSFLCSQSMLKKHKMIHLEAVLQKPRGKRRRVRVRMTVMTVVMKCHKVSPLPLLMTRNCCPYFCSVF